jgi:hypothetical protein
MHAGAFNSLAVVAGLKSTLASSQLNHEVISRY